MKKIIKLVLIIAAFAGMTGMVSCANGSSDDSSSEISATKAKKTTTVKIGDTEYVYTTTDDKVDTSDKVTVADDGSITVKADDGSKITVSKDGKTITYTDKNGKEYTGAFAEETTLKSSDGSEVKATTKSKSETVSADSVNVELPASVGVNELAGKSKTRKSGALEESFSFDEKYYTSTNKYSWSETTDVYRYSYDSTKKLVYLVKISGKEVAPEKNRTRAWSNIAEFKRIYKDIYRITSDTQVEKERIELNTVQAYKYSFDKDDFIKLEPYFLGTMPTIADFHDHSNGIFISLTSSLLRVDSSNLGLIFTDGNSGTFKGDSGLSGTYSVEGNAYIYDTDYDAYSVSISKYGAFGKVVNVNGELIRSVTETTKIENGIEYAVYTNKAGNTVITKKIKGSETPTDERTYKVDYTGGEYTVKYDGNTKKFAVNNSNGTTKTFDNIGGIYISEDFSSYIIIDYFSDESVIKKIKTCHIYSGKDGKEVTLEPYKLNLTFTSIPSGVPLTANKTYTLKK